MTKEVSILLVVVGLTLLVSIGVIIYTQTSSSPSNATASSSNVWRNGAPTKGAKNPKVRIVEFADFECPACAEVAPMLDQIVSSHSNEVALQYRYFPLTSIHPNAMNAAIAAEISNTQGKFWQMHDLLFENQNSWASLSDPTDMFAKFAVLTGQSEAQFKQAYTSNKSSYMANINTDLNEANALGLPGTPSIYINNVLYQGNLTQTDLTSAVNQQL